MMSRKINSYLYNSVVFDISLIKENYPFTPIIWVLEIIVNDYKNVAKYNKIYITKTTR